MIQIEDVHKSFGEHEVLRGLSLEVDKGEVIAIIGGSGSGKSTLLRCVNGLIGIDRGRIVIDGTELTPENARTMRRSVGMVFQQFNLFPHRNVVDNVMEGPRYVLGKSVDETRAKALELLDKVGLKDRAEAWPRQLSGGQQQRVAIARALAMEPDVMLFDEVTSALDPELVGEVLEVMTDLAQAGMTMLVVTHEMRFARDVADRVAFVHEGVVAELGPASKVLSDPENPRMRQFLGTLLKD